MRTTVNRANIRQFVDDMITRTLRKSSQPSSNNPQRSSKALTQMELAICSAIIQVCVQGGEYRNLMTGGADQDERLSWFVKDVLFPLAHILQIKHILAPALQKRTIQL